MQWRFWKSDVVRTQPGRLSGEFLVAYAVVRAVGEIFREPDASLILGLSRGTFYSIFLAIAGVALIVWRLPAARAGLTSAPPAIQPAVSGWNSGFRRMNSAT